MSILKVECLSEVLAGSRWLYNCLPFHRLIAGKQQTGLRVLTYPLLSPPTNAVGVGVGVGGQVHTRVTS